MKFLAGLLAFISSFFAGDSLPKSQPPLPLNTAIITYHQSYFAPAVAEPGNFPFTKSTKIAESASVSVETPPVPVPILPLALAPIAPPPPPPPAPVLPPAPVGDIYLANPEPIVNWYVPITFQRNSTTDTTDLPEMTFNREFWRMEVLAYWAPKNSSRPPVEKDYFKLEVYEKETNNLIYTMTSGTEESIHKFQAFKKSGTYYFKTNLKNPSQFEITFTFH